MTEGCSSACPCPASFLLSPVILFLASPPLPPHSSKSKTPQKPSHQAPVLILVCLFVLFRYSCVSAALNLE